MFIIKLGTQPSFTFSKLTIKTPEQRQWRRSGAFIVNFEHISHLYIVNFEHVIAGWEPTYTDRNL